MINNIMRLYKHLSFKNSRMYWESRYSKGRNSGSGSYGRLAEFKAGILNEFIKKQDIKDVIEFGCGDGNQLRLSNYPKYLGLDISETAIKMCRKKFNNRENFKFKLYDQYINNSDITKFDLSLSLDVIYHLTEDEVFIEYMFNLFNSSKRYVIIYSSNKEEKATAHVKHRKFTDWISSKTNNWKLIETIKNIYPFDENDPQNTSLADFYIYEKVKQ